MIDSFSEENAFLSNFYKSPVFYKGYTYSTVEHAFQAMKTTTEQDRIHIASAATPGIAKRRGRLVKIRSDWEKVKDQIMYELVFAKFSQSEELKEKLLETGDQQLVEGNYWGDFYWGADLNGVGQNKLGKILMRVREELK